MRLRRPDEDLVVRLKGLTGLVSAVSDAMDRRGLSGAVPASRAQPLLPGTKVVGPALTLRYLACREAPGASFASPVNRLGTDAMLEAATEGDVLVIEGFPGYPASVFGGVAAQNARQAGAAAVLVDGAVRDIDEIVELGLPAWASVRTPVTGRGRVEAVELNGWIGFCDVQVRPGDIAVADDSGICFVPEEIFADVARTALGV